MNKIFGGLAVAGLVAVAPLLSLADTISSSTLGTNIDSLNATVYDYFQVLLAKYWPFVVGFGILVLVWHFGRRILGAFN